MFFLLFCLIIHINSKLNANDVYNIIIMNRNGFFELQDFHEFKQHCLSFHPHNNYYNVSKCDKKASPEELYDALISVRDKLRNLDFVQILKNAGIAIMISGGYLFKEIYSELYKDPINNKYGDIDVYVQNGNIQNIFRVLSLAGLKFTIVAHEANFEDKTRRWNIFNIYFPDRQYYIQFMINNMEPFNVISTYDLNIISIYFYDGAMFMLDSAVYSYLNGSTRYDKSMFNLRRALKYAQYVSVLINPRYKNIMCENENLTCDDLRSYNLIDEPPNLYSPSLAEIDELHGNQDRFDHITQINNALHNINYDDEGEFSTTFNEETTDNDLVFYVKFLADFIHKPNNQTYGPYLCINDNNPQ